MEMLHSTSTVLASYFHPQISSIASSNELVQFGGGRLRVRPFAHSTTQSSFAISAKSLEYGKEKLSRRNCGKHKSALTNSSAPFNPYADALHSLYMNDSRVPTDACLVKAFVTIFNSSSITSVSPIPKPENSKTFKLD